MVIDDTVDHKALENGTRTRRGALADFGTGFASLFKGMAVTFLNLVGREKITVQYPFQRLKVSPRYRGMFYLPYDEEAGRLKCVGCTLCEQACPTNVISMVKLGTGKHAGVSEFRMDLGRCMFCNLCIEACPFDAIHMGPEYELASGDRDACVFEIAALTPGGAPNVERNNETIRAALAEEEAKKAARPAPAGHGAAAAGDHAPAAAQPAAAAPAEDVPTVPAVPGAAPSDSALSLPPTPAVAVQPDTAPAPAEPAPTRAAADAPTKPSDAGSADAARRGAEEHE